MSETDKGLYARARDSIEMGVENVREVYDNVAETVAAVPPAATQVVAGSSIIAKFGFLVLIIIVFIILFRVGLAIIAYFTMPSESPYVVKGLLSGRESAMITQDPQSSNAVPILRSNNESTGLEFTWSAWLFLENGGEDKPSKYMHVFNKGTSDYGEDGRAKLHNGPGVYIGPEDNTLHVVMNTTKYGDNSQSVDVKNIPLRKWVHVAVRMQNTIMDVYVNGTVSGRVVQEHVPNQNFYNVYLNQNGGFNGRMSNLRYFNRAIDVFEINRVMRAGPNLTSSSLSAMKPISDYAYLSNLWYAAQA